MKERRGRARIYMDKLYPDGTGLAIAARRAAGGGGIRRGGGSADVRPCAEGRRGFAVTGSGK